MLVHPEDLELIDRILEKAEVGKRLSYTLLEDLQAAFVFENSPQGHEFWAKFAYEEAPVTETFIIHLRGIREDNS